MNTIHRGVLQDRMAARSLSVYRNLKKDPIFRELLLLLDLLASSDSALEEILEAYHQVYYALAEKTELSSQPVVGDPWKNHLLDLMLDDENPFSRKSEEIHSLEELGPSLREAVAADLKILQGLYRLDPQGLRQMVQQRISIAGEFEIRVPAWDSMVPQTGKNGALAVIAEPRRWIKEQMAKCTDWSGCMENLVNHYRAMGCGIFGRYWAFRWGEQGLEGIEAPDPIRLEDLIGYEHERGTVISNTEQFLKGFPANNILLYGDRGTGKSSTVKALLHNYGSLGLRLVEVSKRYLGLFPEIVKVLRQRPQKFILFVDDLSFEEKEPEYKDLKAMLEGGIEIQPSNVLVYATSNRRHLIRESHLDAPTYELRAGDTVQEKLSLSDRFGLTVVFAAPDQKMFYEIVEGLAKSRGIDMAPEELKARARQWELLHNGPSGRTARQFLDSLEGELGMKKLYGD